jgi:CheY-like chemotaxis protein
MTTTNLKSSAPLSGRPRRQAENGVGRWPCSIATVDAIISDILMPRMDGYRFVTKCAAARHKAIPFIFYTSTYTSPGDESSDAGWGRRASCTSPPPSR